MFQWIINKIDKLRGYKEYVIWDSDHGVYDDPCEVKK